MQVSQIVRSEQALSTHDESQQQQILAKPTTGHALIETSVHKEILSPPTSQRSGGHGLSLKPFRTTLCDAKTVAQGFPAVPNI
jgi:hypothetical protein